MIKNIDNKGFTLVELLISMAISVIVIASIAYFMNYSSKNYRNANDEVTLQMEAQTILNQLSDLIMEASNVKFTGNVLTIHQTDADFIVSFDSVNNKLMLEKVLHGISPIGNGKLFGQYVDSFLVVDTGTDNSNKKIEISFNLIKDKKSYSVQNSIVTMRNRIK